MITVLFRRNKKGELVQFSSSGHADYDKKGKDIVCAGVSTLIQTAIIGLGDYLKLPLEIEREETSLGCLLKEPTPQSEVILETIRLGIKRIEQEYTSYLSVIEE